MAISFNWIFSLIAGVLIFIFLVYFAVQNTDLFGNVTSKVVSQELDILFSGIETTKTKTTLDFSKEVELRFSCNNGDQILGVNGKSGSNLHGKAIFSPNIIDSNFVNIATESWNVPFRVANVIYVWKNKYNLMGTVPDINIFQDLKGEGEKVIFRYFTESVDDCTGTGNLKTIVYDYNSELDDYQGYVCFNGDKSNPINFYGKAMMIGAVFSSSEENFNCVQNGMEKRLEIMNSVYQKKSNKMKASILDNNNCKPQIGGNSGYDDARYTSNLQSINFESVKRFQDINDNLVRGGCVGIF